MGLRINSNIASLNIQRHMARTTEQLQNNFRRLSSGLRIVVSSDDAAGLAISERLRSQVRSLGQAQKNTNDAISVLKTGEGAMAEASAIIHRLRELTVQSANGSVSNSDRETINQEFQNLVSELNRVALSTQFNGVNLLDGSSSTVHFHIGYGMLSNVDTIELTLSAALATTLGLQSLTVGSGGSAGQALIALDSALNTVNVIRGKFGVIQNRLNSTINNLAVAIENVAAAESRLRDVDVAIETADLTRNSILQQAAIATLAQANVQPRVALQLLQG